MTSARWPSRVSSARRSSPVKTRRRKAVSRLIIMGTGLLHTGSPEGPTMQLWPATIAPLSHEAYVHSRRYEVISLATPAQHTTMKEQTLCHGVGVDRDDRATEATPAPY